MQDQTGSVDIRPHGQFGRTPGIHRPDRFVYLDKYLSPLAAIPVAPPQTATLAFVMAKLNLAQTPQGVGQLFPMDLNDRYGCCTIAALMHLITLYEGYLGQQLVPPADLVQQIYFGLSGGQDSGLDMGVVLNYWATHQPVPGRQEEILGYVAVDPQNIPHMQFSTWAFPASYVGVLCTQEMQPQFGSRQPWTAGTLIPNEGHCIPYIDYDAAGNFICLTWGGEQVVAPSFHRQCAEEAYAVIPAEAAGGSWGPAGLDVEALVADLTAIGQGPAVVPAPPTPTPPAPQPAPIPAPFKFYVGPKVEAAMRARRDAPAAREDYPVNELGMNVGYSLTPAESGDNFQYVISSDRVVVLPGTPV